jgi:Ras GTPase-activating protein-binding protein 1
MTVEMATAADHSPNNPQMVGNAFVEQYYTMLHQSPELVHKFYLDSSVVSRPGPDGAMSSVTTMKEINDIILSLEYQNYKDEIYSADSQGSYMKSVIVLVTGCLTGNDGSKKQFTQTFFLAPQRDINGYYVLNDIFRYVDRTESTMIETTDVDEISPTTTVTPSFVSEPSLVADDVLESGNITLTESQAATLETGLIINDREVTPLMENGTVPVVVDHPIISSPKAAAVHEETVHQAPAPAPSPTPEALPAQIETLKIQEDAPKKSYASIVNELKGKSTPFMVRAQPPKYVERPRAVEKVQVRTVTPPETSAPGGENVLEPATKGYSIFVANLPMDATVEQLHEIFSKFGTIKPDGVRVRSSTRGVQGKINCYGFVEFENASSVKSALEVSPILIGNRKAAIEEKRGSSDGGRFERRGNFNRTDSFKNNNGNFNAGRNYGRNGFDKRGDGQSRQNGDAGNGKVYQNGGGRGPRQGQEQGGAKVTST